MHNLSPGRLLALAAAFGATIVSIAPVAAQPPPGGPPGGPGMGRQGGGRGGRRQASIAALPVATLDAIVKLTPDQKKKVTAIHDSYVAARAAGRPQGGQRPDEATMQKMRDLGTQSNASIEALLTPAQKTKLDAARQEMALYGMAGIPLGLYGQINLTAAQKAQLKALQPAPPAGGGRPDFRAMMATMQAARTKAAAILTPAQKAQIDKYLAAHPNERGFGGRGGPGGGGPGYPGGPGGPGGRGGRPGFGGPGQ